MEDGHDFQEIADFSLKALREIHMLERITVHQITQFNIPVLPDEVYDFPNKLLLRTVKLVLVFPLEQQRIDRLVIQTDQLPDKWIMPPASVSNQPQMSVSLSSTHPVQRRLLLWKAPLQAQLSLF